MLNLKALGGATIALAAFSAGPASAQLDNLDPRSIEAATKYALPIAFDSYLQTCSGELAPDSFVKSNTRRLERKFAEGADGAWPEARAILLEAASKEADGADALLAAMPDDALRPFVDGIFRSLIESEIKTDQCGDIERGLELLDPLPVENMAGLLGFVIELDNKAKARRQAEREAAASEGQTNTQ